MKEIQLDAVIQNIPEITAFAEEELEAIGCPLKVQMQIDVAIDEIASNICYYAYGGETGKVTVQINYDAESAMLELSFLDQGKPFNPLETEEPDTALSSEDRQIGGLGLFIVKKTMDDVTYRYAGGQNILTLKKRIS